jgi:hypothetical protein
VASIPVLGRAAYRRLNALTTVRSRLHRDCDKEGQSSLQMLDDEKCVAMGAWPSQRCDSLRYSPWHGLGVYKIEFAKLVVLCNALIVLFIQKPIANTLPSRRYAPTTVLSARHSLSVAVEDSVSGWLSPRTRSRT